MGREERSEIRDIVWLQNCKLKSGKYQMIKILNYPFCFWYKFEKKKLIGKVLIIIMVTILI